MKNCTCKFCRNAGALADGRPLHEAASTEFAAIIGRIQNIKRPEIKQRARNAPSRAERQGWATL
jgi:hypothetical protein